MPQVNLDTWRPHVLAALQAKQSFAQYAREHELPVQPLYVAHRQMKAHGEVASLPAKTRRTPPAFVPVHVEPGPSVTLQVGLPNGLVLCLSTVDASLLSLLASLPCWS